MIDSKIISVYQWIVDETGRKPNWLGEHVICASVAVDLVVRALNWKGHLMDWAMLLMVLTVGALLIMTARSEATFKWMGDSPVIRMIFLSLIGFHVATLFMVPKGVGVLYIVSTALTGSYYYFAACEAPRPKKRKQTVMRTAS